MEERDDRVAGGTDAAVRQWWCPAPGDKGGKAYVPGERQRCGTRDQVLCAPAEHRHCVSVRKRIRVRREQ